MAQNVNPRPRRKAPKPIATVNIVGSITDPANIAKIKAAYEEAMVKPTHPPVKCHKPPSPCSSPKVEHEYIDEETELTLEIVKAAIKAGISHEIEDSSGNIHYIINNEMNRFPSIFHY